MTEEHQKNDARLAMEWIDAEERGALRESEARYRRITEAVTDYIYTVRMENGRSAETHHGAACRAVTGYTSEEFKENPYLWIQMVPEEDRDLVREQARQILAGQNAAPVEHRIVRKDGIVRWIRNTPVPHHDAEGRLIAYDGLIRDITEGKQAEDALRGQEHRLRFQNEILLSFMSRGTWFREDLKGAVREITEVCSELMQTERVSVWWYNDDYAVIRCFDLYERSKRQHSEGDELRSADFPEYTDSHRRGQVIAAEDVYTDPRTRAIPGSYYKGHDIRSLLDAPVWLHDKIGGLLSFEHVGATRSWSQEDERLSTTMATLVSLCYEASERRLLEEQVRRAQRMESIGTLAGGVAHNFNNILGIILGNAELAKMKLGASHEVNEFLDRISHACERAARLAAQLLSVAKQPSREKTAIRVPVLVHGIAHAMRLMLDSNIHLTWRVADGVPPVAGDYSEIEQVLMNICLNARDAMPKGGRISIEADAADISAERCSAQGRMRPGRYVCVSVADTGTGMDASMLPRIFDPFFTTKEPGKGTGLGLATAYGTVVSHGGTIEVASELGKGTTFRVYLPAAPENAAAADAAESFVMMGGKETVLVVDDEPAILEMARSSLESLGYTVLTADNGKAALDICKSDPRRIDAVLLDYMMPTMDGEDTYRALRELAPQMRVVVASGYDEQGKVRHLLESGVSGFIHKPYRLAELSHALRAALDQKQRAAPK